MTDKEGPRKRALEIAAAVIMAKESFDRKRFTGGFDSRGFVQPRFVCERTGGSGHFQLVNRAADLMAMRAHINPFELRKAFRFLGELHFGQIEKEYANKDISIELNQIVEQLKNNLRPRQFPPVYVR